MKKFFALVLAIMMVMSLALPAAADDGATATEPTYTITINNEAAGHIYEAYQIFTGTLSADNATLSNVQWGSSIKDSGTALLTAIQADTKQLDVTTAGTTLGQIFTAASSAHDVANILGTVSNDSATLDRLAEIIGKVTYSNDGTTYTHDFLGDPVKTTTAADYNATNKTYTLSGLPAGYYLIKDKELTQNGVEGGFYTKYIVRIVKSDSIQVKGSGVKFEKGINDQLGGTYGDYADFDMNETAYYKWEGTLPTNLRAYDEYSYKFVDTLPAGLDFKHIEEVYIAHYNDAVAHSFYTYSTANPAPSNISGLTFAVSTNTTGKTVLTMNFSDLLKMYPSLLSTDKVIVKYSCTVNKDAVVKAPNTNSAYVEYDNNPNGEGTGRTPDDVAHAFTFKFTVDKFDMADESKKLNNVQFYLYFRTTDANENIVNNYAMVVTEEMVAANETVNGKNLTAADVGKVYGWTTDESKASVLDTDVNGAFTITGLDAGTYFLKEIATADGYNLLTTPVQIDIIPTYTVNGKEISTTVEYKVDSMSQGNSEVVKIRNSKGSTLPSTGGMGTTLFYVIGSVLVLGALVMLITKKRMAAEN